ncbi:hypothetical protein BRADI_5g09112v3 [Brachypodium distachyon]|uniref:Secreted protein n=1 Tax=Brachypodium distachyon TaxID=15368 RepID=A0A0Q3KR28_BRADI|nr:hypothetical protein BRADI_5g09112v3 [Brachypodium distachyon]
MVSAFFLLLLVPPIGLLNTRILLTGRHVFNTGGPSGIRLAMAMVTAASTFRPLLPASWFQLPTYRCPVYIKKIPSSLMEKYRRGDPQRVKTPSVSVLCRGAMDHYDSRFGILIAGNRKRWPDYPCVSRFRQRRLISFLLRQELLHTYGAYAFFSSRSLH